MLRSQRQHFDSLFEAESDPWGYRTRFSERRRHALALAMLDRPAYGQAFEPGCANGVLTTQLAHRCAALLASDASPAAVALAMQATAHQPNVTIAQQELPLEWPACRFDLVVLVDFLYYVAPSEVAELTALAAGSLTSDGTLVVAHWRGSADDFLTSTDDVHAIVRDIVGSPATSRLVDRDHLIDLWIRS